MEEYKLSLLTRTEIRDVVREELLPVLEFFKAREEQKHLPDLLTVEGACEFTCLAKPTIYALVNKRKIPFYKKGKKLYFKTNELQAWIESGRKKTAEELRFEVGLNINKKTSKY